MNRREVIRLGAGVCAGVTAGCLGSSADTADDQSDGGSRGIDWGSDNRSDEHESTESDSPEDDPLERVTIGDRSEAANSYPVYIRNATDDERAISVRVDHDDESVLDRTEDVPADAHLEIVLADPGSYETTVESETARTTTSITRPDADCEGSRTIMTLQEGGIGLDTAIRC